MNRHRQALNRAVMKANDRCDLCGAWLDKGKRAHMKVCVVKYPLLERVSHPAHYGGVDNPYETIMVIEAWNLGFCLGNTVKYISRAGKKGSGRIVEDLEKARWYLDREIQRLKKGS